MSGEVIQTISKLLQDYTIVSEQNNGDVVIGLAFDRMGVEAEKLLILIKDERRKWERGRSKSKQVQPIAEMADNKKPFLNLKEAAAYLGIGESTLRGEANKPGCPVVRRTPRGPMYFDKVDLVKWWGRTSVT